MKRFPGTTIAIAALTIFLSGCFSATVTQSSGGGGEDASSCITIANPESESANARVTNRCNVDVNFLEFSSGSQGLVTITAMSEIELDGFIFAWGACVAPAVPDRVEEFDFRCVS